MKIHLGMNTIYATKRWPEPEIWGQQIGQRWGLKQVQFCFDLLDPRSTDEARNQYCAAVKEACQKYDFSIHNCFIGVAAYTYNYLLHPMKELRRDALDWCGYEQQGKDSDLDSWLRELGSLSPIMHLQQMDGVGVLPLVFFQKEQCQRRNKNGKSPRNAGQKRMQRSVSVSGNLFCL